MPSSQKQRTTIGIALAVLASIIWSGNFIIARDVYMEIPPVSLAFYRWLFASVIILPFGINFLRREWDTVKRSWFYLLLVALSGIALFNTFIYVGAHHTSAINLALIGTTASPIIATVMARIFLKESIGWQKMVGLALCIAGVLYLLCRGDIRQLLSLSFTRGDLWVLTAAFFFAMYNTLVKKKPTGISSLNFLFLAFTLGTLVLLPFYLWERSTTMPVQWNAKLGWSIAYLSIGASVICFWIWNIAIARLGAARTILFGNLIPIFSTLGSVLILNERFTLVHLVSMLLVFSGILASNFPVRKDASASVEVDASRNNE